MIETMTQTGIRTQAVIFQLKAVNAQTVGDPLLDEILDYCIPKRLLERFILYGTRGREAYSKLLVSVDYDEHERRTTVEGDDSIPSTWSGVHTECHGAQGDDSDGETGCERECPVWRQAADWFVALTQEKDLALLWSVVFCDQNDELCRRFRLVPSNIVDRTVGSAAHAVPNSVLPELTAIVCFSKLLWPDAKRNRR